MKYAITLLVASMLAVQSLSQYCDCYYTNNGLVFTERDKKDFTRLNHSTSIQEAPKDWPVIGGVNSHPFNEGVEAALGPNWRVESWTHKLRGNLPVSNSRANVYIGRYPARRVKSGLVMRTARSSPYFQSSSEIVSNFKALYASMRWTARVSGAPNACAGLFTYKKHGDGCHETDIEILTRSPRNRIHFTNQPGEDGGATLEYDMGSSRWNTFNLYRIDWHDRLTEFWINGKKRHEIPVNVPEVPSYIITNMWSDNGLWTGDMKIGHQAQLEILNWDMLYNTTSSAAKKCNTMCQV